MTRTLAAVALICLACGDGSQQASNGSGTADGSRRSDTATTFDRVGVSPSRLGDAVTRFLNAGQNFGTTENAIRAHLGRPDSVVLSPILNAEDAQQADTLVRLYYPIRTFGLYRSTLSHRDTLSE